MPNNNKWDKELIYSTILLVLPFLAILIGPVKLSLNTQYTLATWGLYPLSGLTLYLGAGLGVLCLLASIYFAVVSIKKMPKTGRVFFDVIPRTFAGVLALAVVCFSSLVIILMLIGLML